MKKPVKKIILRVLLLVGLVLACTLIYILITTPLEGGIYGYRTAWTDDPGYIPSIIWFAAIVTVPLMLVVFFPFVWFVGIRIFTYVSLALISWRHKCRFRVLETPFASLRYMSAEGDMAITTAEGTLHIHFVDIVFARRYVVTFPSDASYVLTPVIKGPPKRYGGGVRGPIVNGGRVGLIRPAGYLLDESRDIIYSLPSVKTEDGVQHILMVQSTPLELRVVQDGVAVPVSLGQPVGAFRIYNLKQLKKGLKGELYNSFFDPFDPPRRARSQ